MSDLRKAAEITLLLTGLLCGLPLAFYYLTGYPLAAIAGIFIGMIIIRLIAMYRR